MYSVVPDQRKVITVRGEHINFDKLLIATGSQVTVPNVKGTDLKGVFRLRSNQDMLRVKEAVGKGKKVVLVGGSFISSETAANLKMKFKDDIQVDIVNSSEALFQKHLGAEVGKMMENEHKTNGVNVHNNVRL